MALRLEASVLTSKPAHLPVGPVRGRRKVRPDGQQRQPPAGHRRRRGRHDGQMPRVRQLRACGDLDTFGGGSLGFLFEFSN